MNQALKTEVLEAGFLLFKPFKHVHRSPSLHWSTVEGINVWQSVLLRPCGVRQSMLEL